MSAAKQLINELLVDLFNHILTIESDVLKNNGAELSITEMHTIEAIRNVSTPTMGKVAKKLMITIGTLTTAIDRLVRKGYVTREVGEMDRRQVLLKLTKKSLDELEIHDKFHETMLDALLNDMKIEENETLIEALSNLSIYFKDLKKKL